MLSYAKARNSASPDSRTQAGIYQSPVLLWHQDSLVLSVPCAKAWNSASPDSRTQAGISQSPVLLLHRNSLVLFNTLCQSPEFSFAEFHNIKPFFFKALCRFGTGKARIYPMPCAKAWNSASPDSRPQAGISQSPVRLWHRDSLVLSVHYAKAWNSASPDSETKAFFYFSPSLLIR